MKTVKHKVATGLIKKYMNKKGFFGWTSFWNTIYYLREKDLNDEKLRKHELCHVAQIKREGYIKFTIKYMWYNFKVGYWNNPYEIEARQVENQ